MTKYTSAPWYLGKTVNNTWTVRGDGKELARMHAPLGDDQSVAERDANARLMASDPIYSSVCRKLQNKSTVAATIRHASSVSAIDCGSRPLKRHREIKMEEIPTPEYQRRNQALYEAYGLYNGLQKTLARVSERSGCPQWLLVDLKDYVERARTSVETARAHRDEVPRYSKILRGLPVSEVNKLMP